MDHSETAIREQSVPREIKPDSEESDDRPTTKPDGAAALGPRSRHRPSDGEPICEESRIRKVLVATDFSPCSAKALEYAVALANQCNATLTILHVIDITAQAEPGCSGEAAELMKDLWARGFAKMGQIAWSLCGRVNAQTAVQEGLPWEEIVNKSREADLLVLGKSPAQIGDKFFSEHTTRRLIEKSACPVLVVRETD